MKKVLMNKSGFTVIETIVSLFIFSISLLLITSYLYIQKKIKNDDFSDFFFYIQNIENKNYDFTFCEMNNDSPVFYSEINNKKYVLEKYKNMIRLRTLDGGHIPLMDNVEDVFWQYKNEFLISEIQTNKNKKIFKTYLKKSE
ncbi:hypothetical protein GSH19_06695 [Lactobacillus sp. S2-2]|uniref:competence type IV pilus minor pilin ComGF n=1 Tax=Lactobacillus sp. S2-2 TaxID=2692917 RepID=UPI001F24B88A|nr:competence type IV pilus minor pilin ComGF [Lactobacillus sp. S2-2]MCF6515832.1 hypothetical protein [Lactobacillus sp. S2-2]